MPNHLNVEIGGKQTYVNEGDGLLAPITPGVRDLEKWLNLEPAEMPALLISEDNTVTADLRSATGHVLPSPAEQISKKEEWEASDSSLARLAARMGISNITGCWVDVDAWRDDKGYTFTLHPEELGIEPSAKLRWPGERLHTLAHLLLMRIYDPEYQKPQGVDLDHTCCFTGCCNPHHMEGVTKNENNRRQRLAALLAKPLMTGQSIIGPSGLDWIDTTVAASPTEDTGMIVNTSNGPFRIIKVEHNPLIIRGEPEPDNLLSALRPKTMRKSSRPSRARAGKARAPKEQKDLFHKNRYKKKLPTQKVLYLASLGS
ncbi:MAG TPA: hypothetical protein VLE51_02640 [Candidatus Saccharimonadales bacterium]|nr:hypothetical protein [Candidatus Saccharimonadales bacterium]